MTASLGIGQPGPNPATLFDMKWPAVREALRLGMTFEAASRAAGISADTLSKWRATYPYLTAEIHRAREEGQLWLLQTIREQAPKDARHAEWLLERSPAWRSAYGQQIRIDVQQLSIQLDARLAQLGVDASTLDATDRDAIIASIARQLAPPR